MLQDIKNYREFKFQNLKKKKLMNCLSKIIIHIQLNITN